MLSSWAGSRGADNTEQPFNFANTINNVRSVVTCVAPVSNGGSTPLAQNRGHRRTGTTLNDLRTNPSEAKGDDMCCGAAALFKVKQLAASAHGPLQTSSKVITIYASADVISVNNRILTIPALVVLRMAAVSLTCWKATAESMGARITQWTLNQTGNSNEIENTLMRNNGNPKNNKRE